MFPKSFGVILWEVYTGKKPYDGMRAQHVVMQVRTAALRGGVVGGERLSYVSLAWTRSETLMCGHQDDAVHARVVCEQCILSFLFSRIVVCVCVCVCVSVTWWG